MFANLQKWRSGDSDRNVHGFKDTRHPKLKNTADQEKRALIQQLQDKREKRRTIWFTAIKPWIWNVTLTAFFLMSLYQSLSFLTKYMSGPLITVTDLHRIGVEDMPWITICPEPGYSLAKMKDYEGTLFPNGEWTNLTGIDPVLFGEAHAFNVSVNELVNYVTLPVLNNETVVWLLMSDGTWFQALFDQNAFSPESGKIEVQLENNTKMVVESNVGQWETQFLGMYQRGFSFCSTWKPNVTFSGMALELTVHLRDDFYVADDKIISNPAFMPKYWIYPTQPHETPDIYNYVTFMDGGGFRELNIEYRPDIRLQLNLEKFEMLATGNNNPSCTDDEFSIVSSLQCRTKCLEAQFMDKTCRIPGYRDDSAMKRVQRPAVCKTPEDYARWAALPWDSRGRDVFKSCDAPCPKSCTRMQYEWTDLSGRSTEGDEGAKNFTDIWAEAGRRMASFSLESSKSLVKVVQQQYAYDSHQLLSELGGTWGLFLGLSFLDVLRFFERLLLRLI